MRKFPNIFDIAAAKKSRDDSCAVSILFSRFLRLLQRMV